MSCRFIHGACLRFADKRSQRRREHKRPHERIIRIGLPLLLDGFIGAGKVTFHDVLGLLLRIGALPLNSARLLRLCGASTDRTSAIQLCMELRRQPGILVHRRGLALHVRRRHALIGLLFFHLRFDVDIAVVTAVARELVDVLWVGFFHDRRCGWIVALCEEDVEAVRDQGIDGFLFVLREAVSSRTHTELDS